MLGWEKRMTDKICYIDLDGVLYPYPSAWLQYIGMKTEKKFSTLDEAKSSLSHEEYAKLKYDYRNSDFKYEQPAIFGAVEFTEKLYDNWYEIIISTTRPVNHPKLLVRTLDWLKKNNITFNEVFFGSGIELVSKFPELLFGVDDELTIVKQLRSWGYSMYWIKDYTFDKILREVL